MKNKIDILSGIMDNYISVKAIYSYSHKRALDDPNKGLELYSIPLFGLKSKNIKLDLNNFFDNLNKKLFDFYFLDMFSTFEKMVFQAIDNASGEIKSNIDKSYKAPQILYCIAPSFVKSKDDIQHISSVRSMISKKLASKVHSKLSEAIDHRNWIAHGGRIGKISNMDISDLFDLFKDIIITLDM